MISEKIIGWVKYVDHNGTQATELIVCNPDDEDAIAIVRADYTDKLRSEVEELKKKYESAKAWSGKLAIMHDELSKRLSDVVGCLEEYKKDNIKGWGALKVDGVIDNVIGAARSAK